MRVCLQAEWRVPSSPGRSRGGITASASGGRITAYPDHPHCNRCPCRPPRSSATINGHAEGCVFTDVVCVEHAPTVTLGASPYGPFRRSWPPSAACSGRSCRRFHQDSLPRTARACPPRGSSACWDRSGAIVGWAIGPICCSGGRKEVGIGILAAFSPLTTDCPSPAPPHSLPATPGKARRLNAPLPTPQMNRSADQDYCIGKGPARTRQMTPPAEVLRQIAANCTLKKGETRNKKDPTIQTRPPAKKTCPASEIQ